MQENLWRRGLALFNRGRFFDAHEVLEDVWREAPRHSRLRHHLQGMVQLAVAFHHQSTGNRVGARSLLERALGNLNGAEESFPDLDLKRLRASLKPWREQLAEAGSRPSRLSSAHSTDGSSPPALPKVILHHQPR